MSEKIRVLLSEEEVDARIQEVADMINKDYDGKDVHMICVLKETKTRWSWTVMV